ncbi:MAG: DUF481 domain-containing protein [Planctomycetota bacterium]|nr:DUF481 domain-containing protein [Planctomycetota bacterium]
MPRLYSRIILVLLFLHTIALGQANETVGSVVVIELANGDSLSGTVISSDDQTLVLKHAVLGVLEIPRSSLAPVTLSTPNGLWEGSFTTSVNGARGNADNGSRRFGLDLTRENEKTLDTVTTLLRQATSDGDKTEDRFHGEIRREWLLAPSPWSPFVQGSVQFDEFTDWDRRLGVTGGVGYEILASEKERLVARGGLGVRQEEGGEKDGWAPEMLLGIDWDRTLDERQRWGAHLDLFPNLEDSDDYRAVSGAFYETLLGLSTTWSLKAGVDHFYDAEPGDAKHPWDYNYYLGLGFRF